MTEQLRLGLQTQQHGRSAGCDDQAFGLKGILVRLDSKRRLQVDRPDNFHLILCTKTLRLLLHPLHQIRAIQPFRKPRVVFDQSGQGQLPPGFVAFQDKRFQIGPSRIDCCR